jgi:hypothetical protein
MRRQRTGILLLLAALLATLGFGMAGSASASTASRSAAADSTDPSLPSVGRRDVRRTPQLVSAALTLSPGCSSATLPIDCLITEPVVTQSQTTYPLSFLPGDHVMVTAGGCVQTGGKGATWKRYVNPLADNGLYHGLITIPGATPPLVQLQNVVGGTFTVGGRGGSLILGYQDDGYSDNGYYAHDNGTGNQCLNSANAFVHIVIN